MSFLASVESNKKCIWVEDVQLKFLTSKQMYNKETCYFEALNPEVFDVLASYHEQSHSLPLFKGDEGIVIFKVNVLNVENIAFKFSKDMVVKGRVKLKPFEFQGKKGLTPYLKIE